MDTLVRAFTTKIVVGLLVFSLAVLRGDGGEELGAF